MNINMQGMTQHLQFDTQFILAQVGKFKGHTIKFLNQSLVHIQQDSRLAGATLVVANILFVKVACRIARFVKEGFESLQGSKKSWTKDISEAYDFILLATISLLSTGMNIALYKNLQLPLSPMGAATISIVTSFTYVWRRMR